MEFQNWTSGFPKKIVKWNSKTRNRTPTKREEIQNKKQNPKLTKFMIRLKKDVEESGV